LSTSFPGFLGSKTPLPTEVYWGPANGNDSQIAALTEFVSPGFFTTFDIAFRLGRDFDWDDGVGRQAVAIVNQRLATALFPKGDPIGQFISLGGPTPSTFEIVGVVETTTIGSLREPDLPVVFRAVQQNLTRAQVPIAHVRVEPGSSDRVREAYTTAVAEQGHHYVRSLLTFDQFMNNALIQERLLFSVTSAIAIVGVLLACWGVYAALAYSMAVRTREIAIRMAIGATPKAVLRGVLVDGMTLAGSGVTIGVPVALAVATMVRSQLFGVSAADPAILVSVATGFLILALVAVVVPARRAARTDPSNALRT
jgi:ABC-type antimicrobial peptide transport system permease subunit